MKRLWRKTRQALDRAIYEGRGKQFLWLGGILIVVFWMLVGIGCVVKFDPQATACSQMTETVQDGQPVENSITADRRPSTRMRVLELILDPGSFVGSYNYGNWWFQLLVVLVGATLFTSFLIGATGNLLSRRVESLTKGQYSYDFEDHIVILGASSILENLLKQIGGNGKDIVIQTDRDVENVRETVLSYADPSVMKNVYVVFGKRTNKTSLSGICVNKASSIYVIGEDDEKQHDGLNLKCWHFITEMCAGCTNVKDCYLVLDRLTTHNVFSYRKDSCSTENLRLNIVSAVENMAQGVLVSGKVKDIDYPLLDRDGIGADSEVNVHLVIVGMTQVAYAMAITAAHICHFPNFRSKNKRTKITFVQKDIRQELDFWMGHFNSLMDVSYSEYVSWDADGKKEVVKMYPKSEYVNPLLSDEKGFLDIEWEFIDAGIEDLHVRNYIRECVAKDGKSEYLSLAFCGHDAESNVAASLYLPDEVFANDDIPVFVYQPLTRWVLATAKEAGRYSNLYPFGMRTDCFDPQQERLLWAKRIKYIYDHGGKYDKMATAQVLDAGWYNLGEKYTNQQSNVYAANQVPVKLRSVSLDPKAATSIPHEDVEVLAEVEHNRWNMEKLLNGYSALPYTTRMDLIRRQLSAVEAEREKASKETKALKNNLFHHADIAPYDELLDSSKRYDINIVANILDVIKN